MLLVLPPITKYSIVTDAENLASAANKVTRWTATRKDGMIKQQTYGVHLTSEGCTPAQGTTGYIQTLICNLLTVHVWVR